MLAETAEHAVVASTCSVVKPTTGDASLSLDHTCSMLHHECVYRCACRRILGCLPSARLHCSADHMPPLNVSRKRARCRTSRPHNTIHALAIRTACPADWAPGGSASAGGAAPSSRGAGEGWVNVRGLMLPPPQPRARAAVPRGSLDFPHRGSLGSSGRSLRGSSLDLGPGDHVHASLPSR